MKKYYFSMIVYVDNDEQLEQSLSSFLDTTDEIKKMTKLIVVDSICSELSMKIIQDWKGKLGVENVCYIKTQDMSMAEAYNKAIPEIRGTYVNFSLASTRFDTGVLECVRDIAEQRERPKLISVVPWTTNEKGEQLQYKMSPDLKDDLYENIRFYNKPEKLQLMFHAYFIRTFLIKSDKYDRKFRPELFGDAAQEMLMELLAEWRGYVYIYQYKLYYTLQLEDNTSAFLDQHYEWWYNKSFENWILPFAEKWATKSCSLEAFVRVALLYLIFVRYNCNYNDRNKGVLSGEKLDEFMGLTGKVLQYIDNKTIFAKKKNRTFTIPRSLRIMFLKIKAHEAKKIPELFLMNEQIYFWNHVECDNLTERSLSLISSRCYPTKDCFFLHKKELACSMSTFIIDRDKKTIPEIQKIYDNDELISLAKIKNEQVILNTINYRNNILKIDGTFSIGDFFQNEQIKLKAVLGEVTIPVEFSEIYGLNKVFGVTYNRKYQFFVDIPLNFQNKDLELKFYVELNENDYLVKIRSNSVYAHVRHDVPNQYWLCNDFYCLNIEDGNKIIISHLKENEKETKELYFCEELRNRALQGDVYAEKALHLRKRYFEEKKRNSERIWITFDKLYKAGDNGEYIYDYISRQNDGIDIRYIIKSDSTDYSRMKDMGYKLLIWGEEDTLLTVLLAESVLTTHTNIISYTGFEKQMIPYICDLFNSTNVCIQHGLTTQDIAQFQNRVFDNLQLYLCASPAEISNLSRPIYGYRDSSCLKLTGIARYDGLQNDDKKQILITPTWRRNIANANVAHVKKGHNEYFKNSAYFHVYNTLINDEKLINCAKKYGYRIIYLLHPAASAQIDDFKTNDYVELVAAASDMNYEKILTESSLMVTDYSGVQFDFAYMRKPVIYYHPKSLPPHYEESDAYIYERDAFGPVIGEHKELVSTLCEYMQNGCKMNQKYMDRATRFFAFNDFNNRERIYCEVLSLLNQIKDERYKYEIQ